ncbi:MAG: Fic family protein [Spirochaetaceae bacterium]|jgi:Fic family protein|nr:Fic family protein [Spirochaetaceae bacterium]
MDNYERITGLWKTFSVRTTAELDRYLKRFRVLFAYHSGKIENDVITYNDTEEIFETGKVSGYTGDPRTLFEQRNQKFCYDYLRDKIVLREPITIMLVKEIHCILTSGTYNESYYIEKEERPGKFKKHDYVAGKHKAGSPAREVEEDIDMLLREINEYAGQNILKAGTYFHVQFEYIHPFADGNGRVGRALLNYYLLTHDHPPLIIHNEQKQEYYEALRMYDEDENIDTVFTFLRDQTVQTWEEVFQDI